MKIVTDYFNFKNQWAEEKKIADLGYEKGLTLADDLFEMCPEGKYRGSPFALSSANKVYNFEVSS
jgi:hypothetical protein